MAHDKLIQPTATFYCLPGEALQAMGDVLAECIMKLGTLKTLHESTKKY